MADAEKILADCDALMTGHFILTSGRHSDKYMQCARLIQNPAKTMELCGILADAFKGDSIDAVAAPAVGGIVVGYEIARQLGAASIFAERENGAMTFRRGFSVKPGERVLVAEDVVTTGGSVLEVISLVKAMGGIVVGVALLVDRSGGSVDLGAKTVAAYTASIESFDPDNCPLCKEGKIPPIKPGSRKA